MSRCEAWGFSSPTAQNETAGRAAMLRRMRGLAGLTDVEYPGWRGPQHGQMGTIWEESASWEPWGDAVGEGGWRPWCPGEDSNLHGVTR